MNIVYPVRFDKAVYAQNASGNSRSMTDISKSDLATNITFVDGSGSPLIVNGYDSSLAVNNGRGVRLTNLTGVANGDLLKRCPKCLAVKNQVEFGDEMRITNEHRDQSNCNDCR